MSVKLIVFFLLLAVFAVTPLISSRAQQQSSYSPVIEEPLSKVIARDKAAKSRVMAAHMKLLEERYNLAPKTDPNVTMTRGKPIPVGPTAKLKDGIGWEQLAKLAERSASRQLGRQYVQLPDIRRFRQ